MKLIKCCYRCQDRKVGCHGSCERYMAEKQAYQEEQSVINKAKASEREYASRKFNALRRMQNTMV